MQLDKQDFYWNGAMAGVVNNLYYDLINVDVAHVPYVTSHRNSSFFLKTRLAYSLSCSWLKADADGWEPMDMKIVWKSNCDGKEGHIYVLAKKGNQKTIFATTINSNQALNCGYDVNTDIVCVGTFFNCGDSRDEKMYESGCGNRKLFSTGYVKGWKKEKGETITSSDEILEKIPGSGATEVTGLATGIQINEVTGGTTIGLFSDENVENGFANFKRSGVRPGDYLLVYRSANGENDGFAGQVRMITDIDNKGRLVLDAPRQGFKVAEGQTAEGGNVKYAIYSEWGEVVGFSNNTNVYIMPLTGDCRIQSVYNQYNGDTSGSAKGNIVGIVDSTDKMFVLTKNGYIHFSNYSGYDKFFIQDDAFVGADKISLASYRDSIIAFGRDDVAVGIPDTTNTYYTFYNQSTNLGLWSKESYGEYEGELVFVSNDKRLLAITADNNIGKYMLTFQDVGDRLNGKLSSLVPGDEVFISDDKHQLRVYVNTTNKPYKRGGGGYNNLVERDGNSMTHIYKLDTLFKVWTEDHVNGILLKGGKYGAYLGEGGIYIRDREGSGKDGGEYEYKAYISAYMIENENNGLEGHPLLFSLAKLNRLITTLGPGVYSTESKIRITSYAKGIGTVYEFPLNTDTNDKISWVGLMNSYYSGRTLDDKEKEKIECMLTTLQDGQKKYQSKCTDKDCDDCGARIQYVAQDTPFCDSYGESFLESHGICINDSLYELAPTMPFTTNLGESQPYSTQIKLELVGGVGDIISFGGWLAELFIAPLFTTGPDGEYQLEAQSDC